MIRSSGVICILLDWSEFQFVSSAVAFAAKLNVTSLVNSPLRPGHKHSPNTSSHRKEGPIVYTRIAPKQRAARLLAYRPHEGRL